MFHSLRIHTAIIATLIISGCGNSDTSAEKNLKPQIIKLNTGWEFHWNRFIVSDPASSPAPLPLTVDLPHIWNDEITADKTVSTPIGFASYKKNFMFDTPQDDISIFLRDAASCYRFYYSIDGSGWIEAAHAGRPGKNASDTLPEYRSMQIKIPKAQKISFVFEVANYSVDKGGLWNSPFAAADSRIKKYRDLLLVRDFMLIGALLIVSFYGLVQFFLNRDDREYLFLSMLTMLMTARAFINGLYIQEWLPDTVSFKLLFNLDYFTMLGGIPLFAGFMQSTFHEYFHRKITAFIYAASGIFILMLFFLQPGHIIKFQILYWILIGSSMVYYIVMLFYYRFINNDSIAFVAASGISFFFAAVVHDILKTRVESGMEFIAPYGYLLFVIFLLFIAAMRSRLYRSTMSSLYRELNDMRDKFLHVIRESTNEIENAAAVSRPDAGKKIRISESAEKKIFDAIAYINEKYMDRELNRDAIADHLHLSSSRMGKYFLICTGMKINDYINEIRVNNALRLLKETGRSVIEIAFDSGFDNLSTFNRRFKNVIGLSPSEFRSSIRGMDEPETDNPPE